MLLWSPFFLSFLGLAASYHIMAPGCSNTKQASWILSAIASTVMTLASLPFLWAYFSGGASVSSIRVLPHFAVVVVRFFQAYLAADLTLGSVYYRSRISVFGGWIHHSVYAVIGQLAVRGSFSHIFCLAGLMKIPSLIYATAVFYPHLRSDILFAVAFFATRILFHVVLLVSYISQESRMQAVGGSFAPAITFAMLFPLHVMWFGGCIKGFIRRAAQKPTAHPLQAIPRSSGIPNFCGFARATMVRQLASTLHLLRLPHRCHSFRWKSRSAAETILLSRTIFLYIPLLKAVLDCVGARREHKVKEHTMVAEEKQQ
ncbi:hypothetical protein L208DRAFT_1409445 [Tricholoma matsutake]|nr:hypothetical protein L208DRAFT_1409445 [Tricholoma matsutake 945]